MHKAQVFGYILLSFLIGVFVASFFVDATRLVVTLIFLGTMILCVSGYQRTFAKTKKAERNRIAGIVIGACLLCVALGAFRYNSVNLNHSVLGSFAGREAGNKGVQVELVGFIDEEPSLTSSGKASIVFRAKQLIVPGYVIPTNERTLIITNPYPEYQFGQELSVSGALSVPENFTPDFDYIQYLKNRDIRTTIFSPKITPIKTSEDTHSPLSWSDNIKVSTYGKLFRIKSAFEESINKLLPQPHAAYVNGILLGSREDMSDELKEAFNKTSTTHILAISGFNITVIANALMWMLVLVMRRKKAFWVSVAAIVFFTIMTGAGASVVRAAIMGLLLLAANGYGRWYDPRNSILLAAAVMVWLDPLSLRFDVGFQLSFLAVVGLMYIYPILESRTSKILTDKRFKFLKETLLMTAAAQIMVAPLIVYYFHQFSLVSLLPNLLVLPLMPYVMLTGFLTGVTGFIFIPLGKAIGLITFLLTTYQLHIIQWFAALPFSSVTISLSYFTLFIIYGIIIFSIFKMRKGIQT